MMNFSRGSNVRPKVRGKQGKCDEREEDREEGRCKGKSKERVRHSYSA